MTKPPQPSGCGGILLCGQAASSTAGGFRPASTCRIQDGVNRIRAASSSTDTPRRYAPRIAAFLRACNRSAASRPATVRCRNAAHRNSSWPAMSFNLLAMQVPLTSNTTPLTVHRHGREEAAQGRERQDPTRA